MALVVPGSVGASISASNMARMRSSASSSVNLVSLAKMRAACLATSAMSMPHACGSSKARRSETCSPPSTMAARKTSTPPCSSAVGGTCSASNVAMGSSSVTDRLCRRDHVRDRRQREFFEIGRVWHRHVLAGDARHRSVEPIEGMLGYAGGDLRPDARLPPAFLDRDDAAGLFHRLDDGRGVHGLERAQIYDLGADLVFGQFIGRLERVGHTHRPGDDGHVGAGARDLRLADGHEMIVELGYRKALPIKDFIFEKDNGIGVADRGFEQALGVGGGMGSYDLEAWNVRVPGRVVLAVLGGDAGGWSIRPAEHDRYAHLAA